MVLWFSGTGNSEYIAKKVAEALGQECISIFDRIKNNDFSSVESQEPFIICAPTYCWRIPRVVSNWIEKAELKGNKKVYFLMTCGGEIGNANKYLKRLCDKKELEYMGVAEFIMPENYIAMFGAPEQDEAVGIIQKASPMITSTVERIKAGQRLSAPRASLVDKLKSSIVNAPYYSICVKANSFYTTEGCIGCGKCVKLCPLNNIRMVDGKPAWGDSCTHCMSCICKCPQQSIEYGSKSLNQPRYTCPKI